jgi:predicted transcriptional regulator
MESGPFLAYNAVMSLVIVTGIALLARGERFAAGYRRFLTVMVAGVLVFATDPVFDHFLPSVVHVVHGLAALLVVYSLYDPIHNDLRREEWAALLLRNPTDARRPAEWMTPLDDEILEVFHSSELILTPAIAAYNIDYSREAVSRRLGELEGHGFVERVERGRYRLTVRGEDYLQGYPGPSGENPTERPEQRSDH